MPKKLSGSALITALFIVTIIAIVVSSMLTKLRIDIHNANITITSDKLYLASEAVTYWAIDEIKNAAKPFKALDNQGQILIFPNKYRNIYPGLTTSGFVYDLQGRFNLNNLSDETYKPVFYKLIGKINQKMNKQTAVNLVEATTNWISETNFNQIKHDEWLEKYLKKNPPYLPGYQKMRSPTELRSVHGISAQIYNALEKYIATIPEKTQININTASSELLFALSEDTEQKIINQIVKLRQKDAFKDLSKVAPLLKIAKISQEKLCTTSNYFLVVSQTQTADMKHLNFTILKTSLNQDKTIKVDTLQQSFNTE